MESDDAWSRDAASAREALESVAEARGRLAARAASPYWYHAGFAFVVGFVYASPSISMAIVPYSVIIGFGVVPVLLAWLAGKSIGISWNTYRVRPSTTRLGLVVVSILIGVAGIGVVLQWVADLRWSMAICGVCAFLVVLVTNPRIEAAARKDMREGR